MSKKDTTLLTAINSKADDIINNLPVQEEEIRNAIISTKQQLAEATEKMDFAASEEDFNQAKKEKAEIENKLAYYQHQMKRLTQLPRMSEDDYFKYLEDCNAIATKSRDTFREAIEKCFEVILSARKDYEQTISDVNATIKKLDQAANLLQSIYKQKKTINENGEEVFVDDPEEWKKHIHKFDFYQFYIAVNEENKGDRYAKQNILGTIWRITNPAAIAPLNK